MHAPSWLGMWAGLVMLSSQSLDVSDHPNDAGKPAAYLHQATVTQSATRERLRVLGDASTCSEARFVAYRRSDVEPDFADQWYVASQLWADATLLLARRELPNPTVQLVRMLVPTSTAHAANVEADCHLDKGFIFLDRLWDHDDAGYHARSDVTGTKVERGVRYGDDNALAGLALLATMEASGEDVARVRYRHAAHREADFLIHSGLWDETFGGGFWWNTDRGTTDEGKPAQTNALAALFFARMYRVTGNELYRIWAVRTLLWLDTVLYDPERQLYRRSVRYANPAERTGPPIADPRYFNYDQGLAIEAQLGVAALDGDAGRVDLARRVGLAVHNAFWERERGGYNLEAGVDQVYASYAAWTSLGHVALHRTDGAPYWLDFAQANAKALAANLGEPGGDYVLRNYRCVDRIALGCESGEFNWVVDHTLDTAAQAWTQHLNVALGASLARSHWRRIQVGRPGKGAPASPSVP